jgi:hypothetical protein
VGEVVFFAVLRDPQKEGEDSRVRRASELGNECVLGRIVEVVQGRGVFFLELLE